jgi:glycogen operon protein
MAAEEWGDQRIKCFGMLMDGRARPTGLRQRGAEAAMLIILNSHHDLVNFTLPEYPDGDSWDRILDTHIVNEGVAYKGKTGDVYGVTGRSLVLLIRAL